MVREAVVFAGLPDPGETREQLQTAADRDAAAMTAILFGLSQMDRRGHGVTLAEVIGLVRWLPPEPHDWQQNLRDAIEELCGGFEVHKLGYKFRHFVGRNFGGRLLTQVGAAHGSKRWAAVPIEAGPNHAPHHPHPPLRGPQGGDGGDGGHGSAPPEIEELNNYRRGRDTGIKWDPSD